MVIWVTGISGAGKTTIATSIIQMYKNKFSHLVNIDGDAVRKLYGNDLGYEEKDRIIQIKRMQKLLQKSSLSNTLSNILILLILF